MGIYRKGNVLWMTKQFKGKKVERSLETNNKKKAELRFAEIVHDMSNGSYFEKERSLSFTFAELWEKYRVKYECLRDPYSSKHLNSFFGDSSLAGISGEMVEDYILFRDDEGASASTIYQEFSLARRMLNVARRKWKMVRDNPFGDISFGEFLTIDNKRDRVLSYEEEKALLAVATPAYLKDIIIFAIHTGCRRKEILAIPWKSIDMKDRVVRADLSKRKSGEESKKKVIPMSETLYGMLSRRREGQIRHISGKAFPDSMTAVKDAFERAVLKAKLEDFKFHDLRHTFATRLIQAGADLYTVSQMLGHSSVKMTERYAHHSPASLRPSVKALDNFYLVEEEHYRTTTVEQLRNIATVAG